MTQKAESLATDEALARISYLALTSSEKNVFLKKTIEIIAQATDADFCKILKYNYELNDFSVSATLVNAPKTIPASLLPFGKNLLKHENYEILSKQHPKNGYKVEYLDEVFVKTEVGILIPVVNSSPYLLIIKYNNTKKLSKKESLFIKSVSGMVGLWLDKNEYSLELIRSEQRYTMVFHATHTATCVTNLRHGIFIDANESFYEMTGYSSDDVLGKPADELGILSLVENKDSLIKELRSKRFLKNLYAQIKKKDGEVLSVETTVSLVELNNELCLIFKLNDITQRQRTEEILKLEREKASTYLEIAGVIMIVLNPKGELELINKKGCEVLGYEKDDIIGKSWFDNFLPESIREKTREGFMKVVHHVSEPNSSRVSYILTKAGEVRTIAWNNTIIKDENGGMVATLSSGEDITEKIKAEEQLFASERRFRSLIENSSDVIVLSDESVKISYISPSVENILGYTPEEIVDSIGFNFVHPDDMAKANASHQQHMENPGVIYPIKLRMAHKEGGYRYMEGSVKNMLYDPSVQAIVTNLADVTERVKQEEAVLSNEANLRALIDNTNDAIWSVGADDNVLAINTTYRDLFYANNGVILRKGDSYTSSISDEKRKKLVKNRFKRVMAGEAMNFERSYNISGVVKYYDVNVNPIRREDGKITGAAYFSRDVTERKKSEEIIRRNEANLKALIENTRDFIYSFDRDGKIAAINTYYKQVLYYRFGEEISTGNRLFDYLPDDEKADMLSAFEKGLNGERFFTEHSYMIDGEATYYETSVNPIVTADENIEGVSFFTRNITDRKNAEEEIKQSEEKYRRLIENMNEGVMYMDIENIIQFANIRLCEMTGYTAEELQGEPAHKILLDNNDRRDLLRRISTGKNNQGEQFEMRLKKKNGSFIWVLLNGVPIHDEKENIIGSMGTITDISVLKKTELRLMDTNRELNTFVYKASHDLKGPLTSILGLISLALDDVQDENALPYLQMIDTSSKRLNEILKDLLEAIRIKEEDLRTGLVYFSDIIKEAKESLKDSPDFERVKINTFISLRNRFYSDAKMISSIFVSIMDNAIKYQDNEKEKPQLNLRITDAEDGVNIIIEDNGIGIPDDIKEKVFDMFFRGNQDSKGSGLGLYISKKAIEKLGGEISMESEEGKYTRLSIQLPSIKAEE